MAGRKAVSATAPESNLSALGPLNAGPVLDLDDGLDPLDDSLDEDHDDYPDPDLDDDPDEDLGPDLDDDPDSDLAAELGDELVRVVVASGTVVDATGQSIAKGGEALLPLGDIPRLTRLGFLVDPKAAPVLLRVALTLPGGR